ncbi:unknown [Firmicutes bacterium CAG:137]|nr:unknown [Firmicutes bacterium CAG:137]
MHLIVLSLAIEVQAQHGDLLAGVGGQVHSGRHPAIRSRSGVLNGQLGHGVGVGLGVNVLGQDHAQAHGHIVGGGFLKGDIQLAGGSHIQIGLIQVHEVLGVHLAVDRQGGAAFVGVHQVEIEGGWRSILQISLILRAIVKFRTQLGAGGLKPELPGRQNILKVEVCPFMAVGYLTILGIDQTVSGIEIGSKCITGYHRALCDHSGNTRHDIVGNTNLSIAGNGFICGIPGGAGEPSPLPHKGHPLILVLFPAEPLFVCKILVKAVVNKVGAEGCDRSNHLIVAPHFRKAIAVAPAVATSFVTAKHGSIAVLLDLFLRMLRCPAIVQKLGIRSAGIQIAFIDASCGIVPLNILTGVPQGF